MARPRKNPTPNTVAKSAPVEAVKDTVAVKAEPAEEKPVEAPKPEAKAEASNTVKKTRTKTASKKTEKPEVNAETKKSTAKSRKAEAPAPKKRAPRKPKTITVDDVVAKISKRIDTTAAAALVPQGKAAIDIKLWGAFEAHMYIEIKDGVVNVAPYDYIEKDLEAAVPVDVALAIADGKTTVQAAVENGSLYVFGNVQFALMFAKLFK